MNENEQLIKEMEELLELSKNNICPDCGLKNPPGQKQCKCGANLGVKKCVVCGKLMWSAAGNRTNTNTGEMEFFCEPCWIREVPLGSIFSMTPEQRKKRIALMDPDELEDYKLLKSRINTTRFIKYAFIAALVVGILLILL